MPPVQVFLVRHGETNENVQGIVQGQLDTQLNDAGREQARLVGNFLKQVQFHRAFTSDLQRASDTAKEIIKQQPHELRLTLDKGLRERALGDMEGAPPGSRWNREVPKNAEPSVAFLTRCVQWWNSAIVPFAKIPSSKLPGVEMLNILVVSHGAYIGTLIRSGLVSLGYDGRAVCKGKRLWNTSISIVMIEDGGKAGEIHYYAEIPHLLEPAADGPANADEVETAEEGGGKTAAVTQDGPQIVLGMYVSARAALSGQ
ncbi:hypothetical protein FRB99_005888 [Tulasnella sp. 403]|nr:hypothetical protein FRB99_005888 [Tulasnella sp. 403]